MEECDSQRLREKLEEYNSLINCKFLKGEIKPKLYRDWQKLYALSLRFLSEKFPEHLEKARSFFFSSEIFYYAECMLDPEGMMIAEVLATAKKWDEEGL